jgi:phosphatidate phosphatase LPIN
VSAASGHGSAFEESLRDDSDRESIVSSSERIMDEPARKDPFQGMPGSFSQSHGPLQEPESPTPSKPLSKDNHQIPQPRDTIDPTVNALFPAVVREELTNTNNASTLTPEQKASRAARRRSGMCTRLSTAIVSPSLSLSLSLSATLSSGVLTVCVHAFCFFFYLSSLEVLFDMTGYKTDSCTESSDDDDDLPRGILSDSERHNRVLRKRFSRTRTHLNKEQRQQLVEDIKQGAFLKPEETLANTQLERQSKQQQSTDRHPFVTSRVK